MSIETTPGDNRIDVKDDVRSFCEQYALEADSQVQADVVSLLDKPDTVDVKQFLHLLRTAGSGWKKDRADRAVEIYSMFVESNGADVEREEIEGSAVTDALGETTLRIVQATEPRGTQMALEEKSVIRQTGPRHRPSRHSGAEVIPPRFVPSPQVSDGEITRLFEGAHDAADEDWQDGALCRQTDPEVFFPERGGSTREAKRVCRECPVIVKCLADALERGERYGVWGGRSERERRKLQKNGGDPLAVAQATLR